MRESLSWLDSGRVMRGPIWNILFYAIIAIGTNKLAIKYISINRAFTVIQEASKNVEDAFHIFEEKGFKIHEAFHYRTLRPEAFRIMD